MYIIIIISALGKKSWKIVVLTALISVELRDKDKWRHKLCVD